MLYHVIKKSIAINQDLNIRSVRMDYLYCSSSLSFYFSFFMLLGIYIIYLVLFLLIVIHFNLPLSSKASDL